MIYVIFPDNIWNNYLRPTIIYVDFSSHALESSFSDLKHLSDKTKTHIMFSEILLGSIIKYENYHHFMRFSQCEIESCVIMCPQVLAQDKKCPFVHHKNY